MLHQLIDELLRSRMDYLKMLRSIVEDATEC